METTVLSTRDVSRIRENLIGIVISSARHRYRVMLYNIYCACIRTNGEAVRVIGLIEVRCDLFTRSMDLPLHRGGGAWEKLGTDAPSRLHEDVLLLETHFGVNNDAKFTQTTTLTGYRCKIQSKIFPTRSKMKKCNVPNVVDLDRSMGIYSPVTPSIRL
jgi:hypothetical protein